MTDKKLSLVTITYAYHLVPNFMFKYDSENFGIFEDVLKGQMIEKITSNGHFLF